MSLFQIVAKGGWLMIPISLCSIIAVAVFVERILTLRKIRVNSRRFILQVRNLLLKNQIGEAVIFCKRTPSPIASITKSALERHNRPREEIKEAIESAGRAEIHHLEKYLGVLATIAGVAPLLGFLGTVTGMIKAFIKIEALGGNVGASVLAGGIWEALVTTAAGLSVGIPALIFYNYLQAKVEKFVFEMEEVSNDLLDIILKQEEVPHEV